MLAVAGVLGAEAAARVADSHPFQLHRGHLVLVRGSAGAVEDLVCLLDTGSGRTILSKAVGQALGLDGTPTVLWSFGRRLEAVESIVPRFAAGGFQVTSQRVVVTDLTAAASALGLSRLDAIVGADVLRTRSFSLDFSARAISFGPPPPLRHRAPLAAHPFLIVLVGDVDGRPMRLAIDSGSSQLVLFCMAAAGPTALAADLTGRTAVVAKTVSSLSIGDWEGRGVAALTARVTAGPNTATEGVIGLQTLGARVVRFDFERHEISWSP